MVRLATHRCAMERVIDAFSTMPRRCAPADFARPFPAAAAAERLGGPSEPALLAPHEPCESARIQLCREVPLMKGEAWA